MAVNGDKRVLLQVVRVYRIDRLRYGMTVTVGCLRVLADG